MLTDEEIIEFKNAVYEELDEEMDYHTGDYSLAISDVLKIFEKFFKK